MCNMYIVHITNWNVHFGVKVQNTVKWNCLFLRPVQQMPDIFLCIVPYKPSCPSVGPFASVGQPVIIFRKGSKFTFPYIYRSTCWNNWICTFFRYSTPLHDAVCCGRQEIVKVLIQRWILYWFELDKVKSIKVIEYSTEYKVLLKGKVKILSMGYHRKGK